MELILGEMPGDFDPNRHYVLSLASAVGNEHCFDALETYPFIEPFENPELRARARNLAAKIALGHALPIWAAHLNSLHGVSYSEAFWRVMLRGWLLLITHAAWHKYSQIRALVELDIPITSVRLLSNASWRFEDTAACGGGMQSLTFHHWLGSLFANELLPDDVERRYEQDFCYDYGVSEFCQIAVGGRLSRWWMRKRYSQRAHFFSRAAPASSPRIFMAALWKVLPWVLLSPLLWRRPSSRMGQRRLLQGVAKPEELPPIFTDVLAKVLAATLPRVFAEDFGLLRTIVPIPRPSPGAWHVVRNEHWYEEDLKLFIARAVEAGEHFASYQHGGGYGVSAINNMIPEMEYANDAFLSWGYEADNGSVGRLIGVPAPELSRIRNKHRERTDRLVFASAYLGLWLLRFDVPPIGRVALEVRRERLRFLQALSPEVLDKTAYRPHPAGTGELEDLEFMRTALGNVALLTGPLDEHVLESRLLVTDLAPTILHVAMAANVPTVLLLAPGHLQISPEARPYYDELREVGIVWDDTTKAAQHVNRVWDSVSEWWQEKRLQKARKSWCNQYARTSSVWWWHWAKTFRRL